MNTNKPKPPRKLLSETVVELKTDYPTAVERLQQLSGRSRDTDHDNKGIYFACNRKGMFHIDASNRAGRYDQNTRVVGMRGGLYVEEGKTKAVVYTYRSGGAILLTILGVVLSLVVLGLGLLQGYGFLQQQFSPGLLTGFGLILLASCAFPMASVIQMSKGQQESAVDAEKMRQDTLRRLSAVDEWEK